MKGIGKKAIYAAAFVLCLLIAARLAKALFAHPGADLLSWDQADRAADTLLLAKELRSPDIFRFLVHVFSLNWWPPLYSLAAFPFYLVFGSTLKAAVLPSLLAYPLAVVAVLFAFDTLFPGGLKVKTPGFSLLFSLAVTSPFLLSSSTWVMLEIFGVALTWAAFGVYFRALETENLRSYKALGILFLLLWLLKYHYGLIFGATIVVCEAARARRTLPHFLKWVRRRLLHPAAFPIYAILALIIAIPLTGGFRTRILGLSVSVTGIYNPASFLYLYLLAVCLRASWKNRTVPAAFLAKGQRELALWGFFPVALFIALPDKIKALIMNFEAGHRSPGLPAPERLLYYLRSFLRDYSLAVAAGVAVLTLIIIGFFAAGKKIPRRLAIPGIYFFFGMISLAAGFNLHEARYAATFIPALWIAAAWGITVLAGKIPSPARTILAAGLFVSVAAFSCLSSALVRRAIDEPWAPWAHHDENVRPLIETTVSSTTGFNRLLVIGARDAGFGPLLTWKIQMERFREKDFLLRREDSGAAPGADLGKMSRFSRFEPDGIVIFAGEDLRQDSWARERMAEIAKSELFSLIDSRHFSDPHPLDVVVFGKKAVPGR